MSFTTSVQQRAMASIPLPKLSSTQSETLMAPPLPGGPVSSCAVLSSNSLLPQLKEPIGPSAYYTAFPPAEVKTDHSPRDLSFLARTACSLAPRMPAALAATAQCMGCLSSLELAIRLVTWVWRTFATSPHRCYWPSPALLIRMKTADSDLCAGSSYREKMRHRGAHKYPPRFGAYILAPQVAMESSRLSNRNSGRNYRGLQVTWSVSCAP